MLATFDALLAQPLVLLIVLAVGAGIGIAVEKLFAGFERERRRTYWAERNAKGANGKGRGPKGAGPKPDAPAFGKADASDQLRRVMAASFTSRSLLNKSEAKLFAALAVLK